MSTFPVILERACRDRAVTDHQWRTFREAWSGVAAIFVTDPVVLPASNNNRKVPFEHLKDAFPAMSWDQSRTNRRAMYVSPRRYMTAPFAEELAALMGCAAERDRLPSSEFLAEASRPPPLYFETEERAQQGDAQTLIVDYLCTTHASCAQPLVGSYRARFAERSRSWPGALKYLVFPSGTKPR